MFASIQTAPADPILGLSEEYKKDPRQPKVNLSVGLFCDESGLTPILNVVKQAEQKLWTQEENKVYLPIAGPQSYAQAIKRLLFTGSVVNADNICVAQTLGGTGALRVSADFAKQQLGARRIWVSKPTWGNHHQIFAAAGLMVQEYRYYDPATQGLAFDNMLADLMQAKAGDLVLFHGCCHNPTGVDLSPEQWQMLAEKTQALGILPLFDFAYQGFGQGMQEDTLGLHTFLQHHSQLFVASSFSKNLGLYNERIGACSIVTSTEQQAENVLSQLRLIIRASYSNPPAHGSLIASLICHDQQLYTAWQKELCAMRERIQNLRVAFAQRLEALSGRDFGFIHRQVGMFSYTGLSAEQAEYLKVHHAIYVLDSGRVSIAGLNASNLDYVCQAITGLR